MYCYTTWIVFDDISQQFFAMLQFQESFFGLGDVLHDARHAGVFTFFVFDVPAFCPDPSLLAISSYDATFKIPVLTVIYCIIKLLFYLLHILRVHMFNEHFKGPVGQQF